MSTIVVSNDAIINDQAAAISEELIAPAVSVEPWVPEILPFKKRFSVVDLWSIRNRLKKY